MASRKPVVRRGSRERKMVALGKAFGLVICLIAAYIGLAIKDGEAVRAFGLIWLFPSLIEPRAVG